MLDKVQNIGFRADSKPTQSIFNNSTRPQAIIPYDDDTLELQALELDRQMNKKQKSQERMNKMLAYSSVGIAAGLLGQLLISLFAIFKGARGEAPGAFKASALEFEKLVDNAGIADIKTTKTLSKEVQRFFVDLLDSAKFDPKYLKRAGLKDKGFPNATLLLGDPGTGKTETVRMYAKATGGELATIKLGDFANSFVDGTATNMLNMFKAIKEKAQKEPDKTITILFDEVDGLARKLDKIGSNNEYLGKNRQSFITGLDMILPLKNIRVFATSNVPIEEIDNAVVSRLKRNVTFETPNVDQTFEALKFHLKDCEGLKSDKFDFFKDKESDIRAFLKDLYDRKGAYRDLTNISQDAQARYATAMEKAKDDTMMFDVKYLEEALKEKGIMASELDGKKKSAGGVPQIDKLNFWQKLALFKSLF